MRLSISNIAWSPFQDKAVYEAMSKNGFTGLEIAPTRVFPDHPYEELGSARRWAGHLKKEYDFTISSIQSIWFGRQEKLFGSDGERSILMDYTKKAIDFAAAVGCTNLVFGCPSNRNIPENAKTDAALSFFNDLGTYAWDHGAVLSLEANPPIYNTNYINTTLSAIDLIKAVGSRGFRLNLDVGAMIYNGESVNDLEGSISFINHVHISEPWLEPVMERKLHGELKAVLLHNGYQGYISIEMKNTKKLDIIRQKISYVKEVFQ
jgi:sugar phosphate isomerase/epimerase